MISEVSRPIKFDVKDAINHWFCTSKVILKCD